MGVISQLRRYEYLASWNSGLFDSAADSGLGAIDPCSTNVTVANLQCFRHGLFLGVLCPAMYRTQWLGFRRRC